MAVIFGEPWYVWALLLGVALICFAIEDAAESWGIIKKSEDVDPAWASFRGYLLMLLVGMPIIIGYLALLG